MDRSPKGREIEPVEGNPGDIITRGDQIKSLGTMMLESADVLETIKNDSVGDGSQQGKAIESLKDSIGDSYETLREAGSLYEPVGPVISAYGHDLDHVKPIIDNSVDDCIEKWSIFQGLPGDENGTTNPEDIFDLGALAGGDDEGPTDAQKTKAANNAAKHAAYEDWRDSAEAFDAGYDTWEAAYDTAVDGIGDKMADTIKDSFWGDLTSFLEIAALVIGVAALIIGGPLLAALALAVGALLLLSTIMAYKNGERSGTDIAFAVLGAVPLFKVTSLTKLANIGAGSTKTVLRTATGIKALDGAGAQAVKLVRGQQVFHKSGLVGIYRNRGAVAGFRQLFTGSPNGFTKFYRGQKQMYEGLQFATARNMSSVRNLARIDQAVTLFSTTGRNLFYANLGAGQFGGSVPTIPKSLFVKFAS